MRHAFEAAAIRVSISLANDIFQVSWLPKYLAVVFELPAKSSSFSLGGDLIAQMLLPLLWPR